MKRIRLAIGLMIVMLLGSATAFAAGPYFSDVSSNRWSYENINKMYEKGVLNGIATSASGNFYPQANTTRAEFAAMIVNAAGLKPSRGGFSSLPFSDAGETPPALQTQVSAAYEYGLLQGNERNGAVYLQPNNPVSRQEAATILGRYLGLESAENANFRDANQIEDWAYPFVGVLTRLQLINGYEDNTFRPYGMILREEAATLICKALDGGFITSARVGTFAGNGTGGYENDRNAKAMFLKPWGITPSGSSGTFLVTDSYNNAIREVSSSSVSSVAGKVEYLDPYNVPYGGYLDETKSKSMFKKPKYSVCSNRKTYVSDTENHVIRVIDGSYVRTFAGSGYPGFANGGQNSAEFNQPAGIGADESGNLYVADSMNHCIRKIDKNGMVSVFAGSSNGESGYLDAYGESALFNEPQGIFVKGYDVYVSDTGNQRIRKISGSRVTTVAGSGNSYDEGTNYIEGGYADGKSDQAAFAYPSGLCVTDEKVIFVADTLNNMIRAISPSGMVRTVAGTGEAGFLNAAPRSSMFNQPVDVLYQKEKLYVSDSFNNVIRVIPINIEDYIK